MELLERNPCWNYSNRLSEDLPSDLHLHSPPSIDTSPTFKWFGQSSDYILVLEFFQHMRQQLTWSNEEHAMMCSPRAACTAGPTTTPAPTAPATPAASSWCWFTASAAPSVSVQPLVQLVSVSFTRWQLCRSPPLYLAASSYLPHVSSLVFLFWLFIWFPSFLSLSQMLILQISHNSYFSHNSWFLFLSQLRHKLIFLFSFFVKTAQDCQLVELCSQPLQSQALQIEVVTTCPNAHPVLSGVTVTSQTQYLQRKARLLFCSLAAAQ